ncbi:glycogen debranching protein GlgX [Propionivibrio limicola]|uniref:glycogen debranching protein GlgX n=1 Tax=Propionivibrio limicola TaxID=167645 RepID=UPI00129172F3|nr:glycogen debranching protein GlgX [Propionivibrio limicola]
MGTLSGRPADQHLLPGCPWPLGATPDGQGVNFALFSAHATSVELCLFDDGKMRALPLPRCTDQVWHGYLPAAPGLIYAFRVQGPDKPGNCFEAQQLLLDPYARELEGTLSYDIDADGGHGLKCRVSPAPAAGFDWGDDEPPNIPLADTVLYEIHVKGATRLHPEVPPALRGTYAGLASPPMLAHFKRLGITALNLQPVAYFIDEERLLKNGLTNYWGYNPLAFFVPTPRYAAATDGDTIADEFRRMVRTLHSEGIEVILDVVFNHTAEADEIGPTLSLRGIDNASYYRLPPGAPDRYENFTGCGNTLNLAHPRTLQLVMDALRYWVSEMHVDGFRFDLAATLTRDSAFLTAVRQDPLLTRIKMIAEPWDIGPDGYRLGRFGPGWSEWNDRFRDDVRAFWLTRRAGIGALAQRLAGSSEIFRRDGRAPHAGINFITAHDGFTLRDLVCYERKHNERNGEHNHDGHSHNLSFNCGVEGNSRNLAVRDCRHRLQRALLATLLIAQGVPMLQAGDEFGRSQGGNNNAYCQDNAISWLDWSRADQSLIDFTAGLITLRRRFPQLRQTRWLTGETHAANRHAQRDVCWWSPRGHEMKEHDWHAPGGALAVILAPPPPEVPQTSPETATLLILINRDETPTSFKLPTGRWQQLCDTSAENAFSTEYRRSHCTAPARSIILLCKE